MDYCFIIAVLSILKPAISNGEKEYQVNHVNTIFKLKDLQQLQWSLENPTTIRLFHHSARSTLHIFCIPCYARMNDCHLFSAVITHACSLTMKLITWKQRNNCIIQGLCYAANELNSKDKKLKCLPQISRSAWTRGECYSPFWFPWKRSGVVIRFFVTE